MQEKIKVIFVIAALLLLQHNGWCQVIIPDEIMIDTLQPAANIGKLPYAPSNKKLPAGYEKEALAALSYFPELQDVAIKFRIKKSFATLKTRPSLLSMLLPKGQRTYIITISNKTIKKLIPITFGNLPETARIGILGHELSHVSDFSKKTAWQSLETAIGHLSKHYTDSLEFNTDKICIDHGMGMQLEAWSRYVRKTMHTTYWRGADFVNKHNTHYERYMNPSTIEKYYMQKKST